MLMFGVDVMIHKFCCRNAFAKAWRFTMAFGPHNATIFSIANPSAVAFSVIIFAFSA